MPFELTLSIFRNVKIEIGQQRFQHDAHLSMEYEEEYCHHLVKFASTKRAWREVAQAELFKNIFLRTPQTAASLLAVLRHSKRVREYVANVRSLRIGDRYQNYNGTMMDEINIIATYCPDLAEISCSRVNLELRYLGEILFSSSDPPLKLKLLVRNRKCWETHHAQPVSRSASARSHRSLHLTSHRAIA